MDQMNGPMNGPVDQNGVNGRLWEKDRSLADKLTEQFEEESNLEVCQADFLKWNVVEAFKDVTEQTAAANAAAGTAGGVDVESGDEGGGDGNDRDPRAKVVANIPYNITTDILKTLLPMGDTFSNMVFMFQEEVRRGERKSTFTPPRISKRLRSSVSSLTARGSEKKSRVCIPQSSLHVDL